MKRATILLLLISLGCSGLHVAPVNARTLRARVGFQTPDALSLGGTDAYVTFGAAAKLGLSAFTLEAWIRREGFGVTTWTGNGGVTAIPLITKGRAEDDGSAVDMNYFLGLDGTSGVLVADFEDKQTGANHPINGVTALRYNTWYHVAATYNGSRWQLFLNGLLEAELAVGKTARNDSLQHAALATALDSAGTPEGFFDGSLDEVRIWSYARPAQQIADGMRLQIPAPAVAAAAGLVARLGLNDGQGRSVVNSVSNSPAGTMQGANWSWGNGVKFVDNQPPTTPGLIAPANGASNVAKSPELRVTATDPEGDNLIVRAYGRVASARGRNFSLIALPDTQYYSAGVSGGTPALFAAQTQWIVERRAALNIAYVAHLGDIVENGDNQSEWERAQTALQRLEDPLTTGLSEGLPYGLAVGNHDQFPQDNPVGNTTVFYNQFFGSFRFRARSYYGGRYSSSQDNHYQVFSASGMDFLVLYLEFAPAPDAKILRWADTILKTYPNRRGIIVCHSLLEANGNFTTQGKAIYEALKNNPNLFLMLCGHNPGESWRQDTFNGRTVYTLLADFQNLVNGGDGWLRWLEFSPANNRIQVKTYSPTLDLYDANPASQFTLSYNMENSGFGLVGVSANVSSGTPAAFRWAGLRPNTEYEWYVTVSDGFSTVVGPRWRFRTEGS